MAETATGDGSPAPPDTDLLGSLAKASRSPVWAVLAAAAVTLAVVQLVRGDLGPGVVWAIATLCYGWTWWSGPHSRLRDVTADALVLRRGLRTRTVPRVDVLDVRAEHGGRYGLVLTLRGAHEVRLPATALRYSVAAEQAAALRRWAGVAEPVS